jgi:deoxyxylulose-5-phosphate synthase
LVWDVGRQAYPHKVLTGRGDRLATIKQKDGLAPFPSRSESEYDTFGVGQLLDVRYQPPWAWRLPDRLRGGHRAHVAVIGDGAMSAGLAFEALNHAGGRLTANVLVVLNDNDMSISENVGALSNYFARVLAGRLYSRHPRRWQRVLRRIPAACGICAPLRGTPERHGSARHDVRGNGAELHRSSGRTRRRRSRPHPQADQAQPAARSSCMWSRKGQGLRAG